MSFVKFLWSQYFFWYFIPQYLVNCCSESYKTYYFLKEHDEVFQLDINKLLRFQFLAEVNIILEKTHYFSQSKNYNSGRKTGNLLLLCLWYWFLYLKNVRIHFHGVPLLVLSGLHNTLILEVKAVGSKFCLVQFRKHTH